MNRAELPHFVELEDDDWRVGLRVVPPADPRGTLRRLSDLIPAKYAVDQLAQAPPQLIPPLPVVRHIRKFHTVAAPIAFWDAVGDYAHCGKNTYLNYVVYDSQKFVLSLDVQLTDFVSIGNDEIVCLVVL